jgi:hypothetical protein
MISEDLLAKGVFFKALNPGFSGLLHSCTVYVSSLVLHISYYQNNIESNILGKVPI